MHVVLNIDPVMRHWPVAGVACVDRMRMLLEPLGDVSENTTLPSARPLLVIQGLFPLLEAHTLDRFLAFAKRTGGCWTSAERPDFGLTLLVEPTPEIDFAALAERLPRWSAEPPPEPLRDGADLARFNATVYEQTAAAAMANGALLLAPKQTWIEESVSIAAGTVIEPCVYLAGRTRIAAGARIQMGAHLRDTEVAEDAQIKPYSVIEGSTIGAAASIGPFAHVRPGSELGREVRVGNFVETKKIKMGEGSKASHLSYLGDAEIGRDCNIGAGTITCNYDGYNKWTTQLGDRVFIGSDSQLVAPVTLGDGSYVAAGSTITGNVPANALAICRARQANKDGMAEKLRQRAKKKKSEA